MVKMGERNISYTLLLPLIKERTKDSNNNIIKQEIYKKLKQRAKIGENELYLNGFIIYLKLLRKLHRTKSLS